MMTVYSTLAFEEFLINVVRNSWNFVYILRDKVVSCHFEPLYSIDVCARIVGKNSALFRVYII